MPAIVTSEQPTLGKTDRARVAHHDVVQQSHVDQLQCGFQGVRQMLVGTAGLAAAMFGVSAVLPEAYRQETVAFMRYDAALRRSLALSDADIGPLARGIAVANGRGDFDIARTPVPPVTP